MDSDDSSHEVFVMIIKIYVPKITFTFNMKSGVLRVSGLILKRDENGVIHGHESLDIDTPIDEIDMLSQMSSTLVTEISSYLEFDHVMHLLSTHFKDMYTR
eukprot:114552_1